MLTVLVRAGVVLTLLFTVGVGLVAGLMPHDDRDLRQFFLPPAGCPAPCWLGIRPGETRTEDAVRLLEAHEWVAAVRQSGIFHDIEWSGQQPTWIDTSFNSHFRASGPLVETIRIRTTLPTGALFILLGRPETGLINTPLNSAGLRHTARFEVNGAEISSLTRCPMQRDGLWYTPVEVQYRFLRSPYSPYTYNMADWLALRPCR